MQDMTGKQETNQGTVLTVRGSVVDVRFPKRLPFVYSLLRAGDDGHITIEVQTHLNAEVVREITLTPTQGFLFPLFFAHLVTAMYST